MRQTLYSLFTGEETEAERKSTSYKITVWQWPRQALNRLMPKVLLSTTINPSLTIFRSKLILLSSSHTCPNA